MLLGKDRAAKDVGVEPRFGLETQGWYWRSDRGLDSEGLKARTQGLKDTLFEQKEKRWWAKTEGLNTQGLGWEDKDSGLVPRVKEVILII